MTIGRPDRAEFAPFYDGYIAKVPDSGPMLLMKKQLGSFDKLRSLSDVTANLSYAAGKWTVKELIGHIADAERVMSYRLTRIARGDKTPLPGWDENAWAREAPHRHRPVADVVDELMAVRRATFPLMESLDETTISHVGTANGNPVSARAICWILAGHAEHHLSILRDRYGVSF